MPESVRTWLARWGFNLFPAYRASGARIAYIAGDWREVCIRLPLTWRTRNYVGTIFGGSMYAAVDPIYMVMLMKALGPGYVVWDRSASIHFKKPGRTTLYARFVLPDGEISAIRDELTYQHSVERLFTVDLVDAGGVVNAVVEKYLYIRLKNPSQDRDG